MHQHDESNAYIGVDYAEQCIKRIKRLCDNDAKLICRKDFDGYFVFHKLCMLSIPIEAQDDPLLTGLASGYVASRIERPSQQRVRRPRSRLRVYGCLFLLLVVLVGPLIGLALTKGLPHQTFTYVLVGVVVVFLILILIAMLATRRGREAFVGRLYGGLS